MKKSRQGKRPSIPEGWIAYKEAARRLGCSTSLVSVMVRDGRILGLSRYGEASARKCGVLERDVDRLVADLVGVIKQVKEEQ